MHDVISQCCEL